MVKNILNRASIMYLLSRRNRRFTRSFEKVFLRIYRAVTNIMSMVIKEP